MSLFQNPADDPSENPNFEPERQCCGYTVGILCSIDNLYKVFAGPFQFDLIKTLRRFGINPPQAAIDEFQSRMPFPLKLTYPLWADILCRLGALIVAVFFIMALHNPKFLGGNPKPIKILPLIVGLVMYNIAIPNEVNTLYGIGYGLLAVLFYGGIAYGVYIKDDTSPASCCLCLKPWVYKSKMMAYPPQGYPPYGAPAPQGYPPYGAPSPHPQAYQGHPPQVAPHMYPKV